MSFRVQPRLLMVVSALILSPLLPGSAVFAAGPDFDYAVERFEVIGNRPGNLSDEFEDGFQSWFSTPGSDVTESDGALHLMGPGVEDSTTYTNLNPAITLNRSDAFSPGEFAVLDGFGDFNASSTWRNLPEGPGGFYSMGLRYFAPNNTSEGFSVSISALDAPTAAAFGAPEGLVMSFAFFEFDTIAQALISNDSERFVIDPADVTGDVFLRLVFDDLANEISAKVSLNGGSSFLDPFATRAANLQGAANFFLFGDPVVVPEPGTALLMMMGLAGLSVRRR